MIAAGATIGILGAGQLGRMLAMAAARLGYRAHVYAPTPGPAGDVALATWAGWDDRPALAAFAADCAVVTYEFENVPAHTLDALGETPTAPPRRALEVAQDRLTEKRFLRDLGLATAAFAPVDGPADLTAAAATTGWPARLKTRRLGYDGHGQAAVATADAAAHALAALAGTPAILEAHVAFDSELSVVAARGRDGTFAAYDPGTNRHAGGILAETRVPAGAPPRAVAAAIAATARVAEALDYVGVLGVEFFVLGEDILVNEIAPRVHNSGHWTEAACQIDQFEQHIRAVAGLPLGDGRRHADAVMTNLLGAADLPALAADPAQKLHLYGKAEARPGRKMGHTTRLGPRSG